MNNRGLVSRPCPNNGRSSLAGLTDRGLAMLTSASQGISSVRAHLSSTISVKARPPRRAR
jgi:hypothetical protein